MENATHIAVRLQDNISILDLPGAIDSEKLQAQVTGLLGTDRKKIALNLSNINFIESSGLGALVAAFKQAQNAGADLVIFGLQPYVKKLVEITKLNRILKIVDNELEAAQALQAVSS